MLNNISKLYRRHDPDTSKKAAESIVESLTLLQEDVLAYARDCGSEGFTDEELSHDFHCYGSTYRSRRAELTKLGKIVPTDRRRRMASGRNAVVWMHKEFDV
jgi:hypothetical protein